MTQLVPTSLEAKVFSTEVDLTWENDPNATSVLVLPTGLSGDQSLTRCSITGLAPGTTYIFTIVNTAPGSTAGSVSITVTTHRSSQLAPRFGGATVFSTEIDLTWENDPNATDVLVLPIGLSGGQSLTRCSITGLTPNTTYLFTIVNTAPGSTSGSVTVAITTHH